MRVAMHFFAGHSVSKKFRSRVLLLFCVSLVCAWPAPAQVQFVGRQDSKGTVFVPSSVALDAAGNAYITEVGTASIFKLDQFGNQTVVGSAVGFWAVAIDSAGNLYYTAFGSNCVTEIPVGGGAPICLGAGLSGPVGIAVDASGNLYVADNGNQRVEKIAAGGGQSTLLTGFTSIFSVAVDKSGNVYAADSSATSIAKIPPGGGSSTSVGAVLSGPQGVAVDADGNVYVCQSNNTVAKITAAGAQSVLPITGLNIPVIPAVDANGNLYIASRGSGKVVLFNALGADLGYAEVCSGGNPAPCSQTATLNFDFGSNTFASVAYFTGGVTGLDFTQSATTCTALSTSCSITVQFAPLALGTRAGAVVVTDSASNQVSVPVNGVGFGAAVAFDPPAVDATVTGFPGAFAVAVDGNGLLNGNIYVFDFIACKVFKTNAQSAFKTAVAGNGTCNSSGASQSGVLATSIALNAPYGVALDGAGNIYVSENQNNLIRKVDTNGIITTVAGNRVLGSGFSGDGGPATGAQIFGPQGVTVDREGNLYFADFRNNRIRKVDLYGIISTFAGSSNTPGYGGDNGPAKSAQLNGPVGVRADSAGNIFIADVNNNVIRKVDPSGIITTVAGNQVLGAGSGGNGGLATSAQLNNPFAVAADAAGNIFILEGANNIRRVDGAGNISLYSASASLTSPNDIIADGTGNLAVVDVSGIVPIDRTTAGVPSFGNQTVGTSSAAKDVTVTDSGNQSLAFSQMTPPASFNLGGTHTSCSAPSSLGIGLDCILGVVFMPTAAGPATGMIALTDNALGPAAGSTQTIGVSGAGVVPMTNTTTVATLTVSPNPAIAGQPVTLTANVSPAPSGSSLGTVSFFDGSTQLGTANVNSSGVATFTTSTLPSGIRSLTGVYSGNATFAASTSNAFSETVNAAYAVIGPQTPIAAPQGAAVNVNLSVPPIGGSYISPVTMSASGLPPGVTVTFLPPVVTPGAVGAATMMTVQLPKPIVARSPSRKWPIPPWLLGLALAWCGVLYGYRWRKPPRLAFAMVLLAGALMMLAGCNGGLGGPMVTPGNYTITITGTSGSLHESTTITLVVH